MTLTLASDDARVNDRQPLSLLMEGEEPPHNLQVEQALLSAVLVDSTALHAVATLKPEDFYFPAHGQIFATILNLAAAGRAISPVTLAPYLPTFPGGPNPQAYLTQLVCQVTSTLNASEYGLTIREFAARRRLAELGRMLTAASGNMSVNPSALAGDAVQELDSLIAAARSGKTTSASLAEAAHAALDSFRDGVGNVGVPTGLKDLDQALGGGMPKPEFMVYGARPSMGKTAFACSISRNAARAGFGVLFFSLEMPKEMIATRVMSDQVWNRDTPMPYERIRRWDINSDEYRLRAAADRFKAWPFQIEDQPGLTVSEIAAKTRQWAIRFEKSGVPLSLVIVDHLGKIRASDRYAGQSVLEIKELTNGLFNLSKELNISMVALHQLNRGVEGREDKRPDLADLRGGGSIEEDAGIVGFLYRHAYYLRNRLEDPERERQRIEALEEKRNVLDVILAKNRNGPCATIKTFVSIENNVVRNWMR